MITTVFEILIKIVFLPTITVDCAIMIINAFAILIKVVFATKMTIVFKIMIFNRLCTIDNSWICKTDNNCI